MRVTSASCTALLQLMTTHLDSVCTAQTSLIRCCVRHALTFTSTPPATLVLTVKRRRQLARGVEWTDHRFASMGVPTTTNLITTVSVCPGITSPSVWGWARLSSLLDGTNLIKLPCSKVLNPIGTPSNRPSSTLLASVMTLIWLKQ